MIEKLKKIDIYKVLWVSCLFLGLIVILIMVMDYKINYQYIKSSEKLYFFACDNDVCTSNVKDKNKKIYSVYDCWYNECPVYKKIIYDDYALLSEDNGLILYNYKNGSVISSGYENYVFINNDYIIVTRDSKYGVIDIKDNVIVNLTYEQIGYYVDDLLKGYNTNSIIAKKDGKYGIISFKDGKIVEEFNYSEDKIQELLGMINK